MRLPLQPVGFDEYTNSRRRQRRQNILARLPPGQPVHQGHGARDGNGENRGARIPPAPRDPVESREQQQHGRDIDQVCGVPAPAEQQVERRRQRRDERRLKTEHRIEFGQIANHTAVSQRVVDGEAVGQVPRFVPGGRHAIQH